jgi:hypothetical protein
VTLRAAALIAVTAVAFAGTASAHVVSDRELRVVRQFPAAAIRQELRAYLPDSLGNVAPNRPGAWRNVAYQRPALLLLIDASGRGDSVLAERAWRAIDGAFAAQLPGGAFRRDAATTSADSLMEGAAFVSGLCRALIAVMNGPLQERFRWRYSLLRPKLQHAVDWLEAAAPSLRAAHARRAGLLLVQASAFLLADGTYHEERYGRAGQAALSAALELQHGDGLLPSNGAANRSEHALGLEALQSIAIYFPSPTLERAGAKGASWLRAHPAPASHSTATSWTQPPAGEIAFTLRYATIKPPPPLGVPYD